MERESFFYVEVKNLIKEHLSHKQITCYNNSRPILGGIAWKKP